MNKATAIREMRKLLKASSFEDAYNIYKEFLIFPELTLISDEMLRKNIVKHYITQNDKALLKFANGLTDDLFDFVRYEQYKEFRNNHKFDGGSKQYFKLKYGDAWKQFFDKSKNTRFNMYNIDYYNEKRGKGSGYYHIDHRYSRLKGYQNNIPPYIIGHVTNLQWLLSEVNCSKKEDCSITEKELLEGYLKYENKINKKT